MTDDDWSRTTAGTDDERVAPFQTSGLQVMGKHPHPVAAHLGDGSVGVPIIHEPVVRGDAVR